MPSEFERAAWEKRNTPDQHPARRALEIALDDLNAGRIDPSHIVVCYTDHENITGFYQAGSLHGYFGTVGLIERVKQLILGNV